MTRRLSLWTLLFTMVLLAPDARGQGPYGPRQLAALRGSKVRLHTLGGTVQGMVQGVDQGDLLVRRSSWQTDSLPVDAILRVEVYSRDRGGTLTGMTLGGGLGLGLGLGVASWLDSVQEEGGIGDSGVALMGSLGALVGATLGAHLMGSVWTPLPARPPEVSLDSRGDALAIAYAWRF